MPNITRFNVVTSENDFIITADLDNGNQISFRTKEDAAALLTLAMKQLSSAYERVTAAENRAAAATRTADRLRKKTGDQQPAGAGQPPQSHGEFLKMVWKAVPSFTLGVERDPRAIAIDVLRFVPMTALKAASGYSQVEHIPLSDAVSVLESVGAYMKVNGIQSKPYVPSINGKEAAKKRAEWDERAKFADTENLKNKEFWKDREW
ncbi:hypothetical protein FFB58_10460 [Enterobacter sp. MF024]|uniref:hypothetical protein n=1 Tax=Enterobacter sp. MF024 TaxID=2555644 RepID=UPI0011072A9A|nr:hypothetical protein [Enterobacter sp. MF024]TLU68303.1 hypothetical protein FFB58_10460 [Enterobacter sp. MF024]